jgi:hypothetical protein
MDAGFKIDDKDFVSIVQGEDAAPTLRVYNKDTLAPLDLDTAVMELDLPAANEVPIKLRTTATLLIGAGDVTEDTLSITDHGLAQGEAVTVQQVGTLPTGLTNGATYYVLVEDKDTIQLCVSADLSDPVDLTVIGSGANTLTRTSLLAHGAANLGQIVVTIKKEVAAALKAGSRQSMELEYVLTSLRKIIQLEKALTVLEQKL